MRICDIDTCSNKHLSKGYCSKHYYRFKRTGSPYLVRSERHGMRYTSEYKSWCEMKYRCFNLNCERYSDYGGRGITVCDEWKGSFSIFYNDMGDKPSDKHSLDRIDNNGNYEPSNCRWATDEQQARNQRIRKSNTTGVTGVYKVGDKWVSKIGVSNKLIVLGTFKTKTDAVKARKDAEKKYW